MTPLWLRAATWLMGSRSLQAAPLMGTQGTPWCQPHLSTAADAISLSKRAVKGVQQLQGSGNGVDPAVISLLQDEGVSVGSWLGRTATAGDWAGDGAGPVLGASRRNTMGCPEAARPGAEEPAQGRAATPQQKLPLGSRRGPRCGLRG